MPELPEVETIRRGLQPRILGRRIQEVRVREHRLRWPVDPALSTHLRGHRIEAVERRSKYLLLCLDNGNRLIVHLGMSGRLCLLGAQVPGGRHDHLDLTLDDAQMLRFHDPRRFGAVLCWPADQASHPLLAGIGPEPFDDRFNGEYLFGKSRGRRAAIKNFLMDTHIVAGTGNIYASESLFQAGIRPARAAGRLSRAQFERLVVSVRAVLHRAIECGGTTLRDFAGAAGEAGYFQQDLFVYGRQGQPCRRCQTPIKRVIIAQRSSFYCPRCQC